MAERSRTFEGFRQFEPELIASLETSRVVAEFDGEHTEGFRLFIEILSHQFQITKDKAVTVAANMLYAKAQGQIDNAVEEKDALTRAYNVLSEASGLGFNPEEAALKRLIFDNRSRVNGIIRSKHELSELMGHIYSIDPYNSKLSVSTAIRIAAIDEWGRGKFWHEDKVEKLKDQLLESYSTLRAAINNY